MLTIIFIPNHFYNTRLSFKQALTTKPFVYFDCIPVVRTSQENVSLHQFKFEKFISGRSRQRDNMTIIINYLESK